MIATTRSGALVRTMMGLPVLASVVTVWFAVHVRGRSRRHRDELFAMEGAYLDDSAPSAVEKWDEELDEATAVVLG